MKIMASQLLGHTPASADPKTNVSVAVQTLAALDSWGSMLWESFTPNRNKRMGDFLVPCLSALLYRADVDRIWAEATFHDPPLHPHAYDLNGDISRCTNSNVPDRTARIAIVLERTLDSTTDHLTSSSPSVADPSKVNAPAPEASQTPSENVPLDPNPHLQWKFHAIRLPEVDNAKAEGPWYDTPKEAVSAYKLKANIDTKEGGGKGEEEMITSAEDFWDGFDSDASTRSNQSLGHIARPDEPVPSQDEDEEYWNQYDLVQTATRGDESADLSKSLEKDQAPSLAPGPDLEAIPFPVPQHDGDLADNREGLCSVPVSSPKPFPDPQQLAHLHSILRGTWGMLRTAPSGSLGPNTLEGRRQLFLELAQQVVQE